MFAAILQDEPQQPLALVPLTEEEQVRNVYTHTPFIVVSFSKRSRHNVIYQTHMLIAFPVNIQIFKHEQKNITDPFLLFLAS